MRLRFLQTQLAILATLAILLLVLSVYAHGIERFPADLYVAIKVQSVDGEVLLAATRWVSYVFGGWRSAALVLALAFVMLWRKRPREAATVVTAGVTNLLNFVLKIAVDRARPAPDLVDILSEETTRGFPSGHACFSILILGLLAYLAVVHFKSKPLKALVVSALVMLILFVGFARIFLGVHWPSDVLGGYLAGGFLLTFVIIFYQVLKQDGEVHRRWWLSRR